MIDTTINRINQDINYFTNVGFKDLADKFKQDLECINYLKQQLDAKTKGDA